MKEKQFNPPAGYFGQMALDLVIEEEAPAGRSLPPSPEEARLRSEAARELLEAGSGAWMEDYAGLRTAGWPWRVAAYIAWASSPKIEREPRTLGELASVLGLTSPRTIHHWRETNPAIDEVIATLQAAPLMAHRRDVFEALAKSASDSDHRSNPDRKLFLEITGDYVPRSKVEVESGDPADLSALSEAELDVLARKALKRAQGPREDGSGE